MHQLQRAGRGTGLKRPLTIFAAAALGAVALDQLTKALVRSALAVGQSIDVLGGVAWLTHVRNSGGAFSIMQGRIPVFVVSAAVVIVVAVWYMIAHRPKRRRVAVALGLIVGGAMGNLIDRVATGKVTDFIAFQVFPVFNAADIAIVGGMTLLVWIVLTQPEGVEAIGDDVDADVDADVGTDVGTDGDAADGFRFDGGVRQGGEQRR